jgi:hypothetical protein
LREAFRNFRLQQMPCMLKDLPAIFRWQRFNLMQDFSNADKGKLDRSASKNKSVAT